jgi:probable HAF family extracellular repeat protein
MNGAFHVPFKCGCAFLFAGLAAPDVLARDAIYSVTDLGTLGGTYVYVSGINNLGQVVGNGTTNGTFGMRAFVYSSGKLMDLGTLGGTNSYGYAINDSGQVVGSAYTAAGQDDAYVFSSGSMMDLGALGGTGSDARAINQSGQIAGGAWTKNNAEYHAYFYSAGTKTDLGTLGGTRSGAFGINDSGDVVGRASLSGISPYHAFLYTGGVMNDLGTLGGSQSFAYGVNNARQVVGGAYSTNNLEHAFLYTEGIMQDLTPGPLASGRAYAINNHGQVVGYTESGAQRAFMYSGATMLDLNDYIEPNTGWTLELATAINDQGQIAGVGTHPSGTLRVFLLTPVVKLQISLTPTNTVQLHFMAQGNTGYAIEYRDSLSSGSWQILAILDPIPVIHAVDLTDPIAPDSKARFYRVRRE